MITPGIIIAVITNFTIAAIVTVAFSFAYYTRTKALIEATRKAYIATIRVRQTSEQLAKLQHKIEAMDRDLASLKLSRGFDD